VWVGRGIALLFHDRGTRRGWVVSSTPRPHFTLGKDPVPILKEAGWTPGPVWTGGKSRPHRDFFFSIPNRPARSQSLYRLSYPAHMYTEYLITICIAFPPPTQPYRSLYLRLFVVYSLNWQINFCKHCSLQTNGAFKYNFAGRIICVWR